MYLQKLLGDFGAWAAPAKARVLSLFALDRLSEKMSGVKSRALIVSDGMASAWHKLPGKRFSLRKGRSLIGEILALQLMFALFISIAAVGGVWWTSSWVIDDNFQKWGERWLADLDDLGMPLYGAQDEERYQRIQKFVRSFPEIAFVRYYSAEGQVVFADYANPQVRDVSPLAETFLDNLAQVSHARSNQMVLLDEPVDEIPVVRLSKPIWTESLAVDGLLDFDPDKVQTSRVELVGFVELGLDFRAYQGQLNQNIITGGLVGVLVLLLLTLISAIVFRRALRPLAELQHPLRKLASGSTDFKVETTGHMEIVAIADALNSTVSALNERDKLLWQLANRDSLTGLVSRHRFSEVLEEELGEINRRSKKSALLFIDLDQFKYVNDTLGHAAGDRFLQEAAGRLTSSVRRDDIVSRFGGDEFTILIRDIAEKNVKAICEAMVKDMREHRFMEGGKAFSIPCSIGVTMFDSDTFSPAELMAQADMACHDAKAKGRNRYQLYKTSSKEMNQMAADVSWSQEIQRALKENSFVMHYQPIVDLRTGKTTHYEALLRLRSDDGQLVPPTGFLPSANRFGLMQEVDEWVIAQTLTTLAKTRKSGRDVRFTLNISGNIFEDESLCDSINRNLVKNALAPEFIVLEITEQIAVKNIAAASQQIEKLAKLGCKFAIDDFGAGYSSYSYLKKLPVDYIKIDGSFIRGLAKDKVDQTIVRSITQIAKATKKMTIAEHVTDAATFDLLLDIGVDYAQGFYVGKPAAKPSKSALPTSLKWARKRKNEKAG